MIYLFAGVMCYPRGGVADLIGKYKSIEEMLMVFADEEYSWWHATDESLNIVVTSIDYDQGLY